MTLNGQRESSEGFPSDEVPNKQVEMQNPVSEQDIHCFPPSDATLVLWLTKFSVDNEAND